MKLFIALALCLALASCSPRSREEEQLRAGEEGDEERDGGRHGGRRGGRHDGSDEKEFPSKDSSDEDSNEHDDHWETPMNVNDFREEMQNLLGHIREMKNTSVRLENEASKALIDDPSEEEYEHMVSKLGEVTKKIELDFDHVALKLSMIAYKLYRGAEGFDEVNHCDSFKQPPEQVSADPKEMAKELGKVFVDDLKCFSELFAGAEVFENELGADGEHMTEDKAMGLVLEILWHVHVVRLNAQRFKASMEGSVHELMGVHGKPTQEVKKLLKLRSLLLESGLLS